MTVAMSSEGDNSKNASAENTDKKEEEASKKSSEDVKEEESEKNSAETNSTEKLPNKDKSEAKVEKEEAGPVEKKVEKGDDASEKEQSSKNNATVTEKNSVKDENEDTAKEEEEGTEESGKEEESDKDEEKDVPLLDRPLEQSGKRERKNVQRFNEAKDVNKEKEKEKEKEKVEIADGNGTCLGNIPRIDASISRFKNDDMKLLHRILFKTPGKSVMIKKNIKKFNGFDFKKDSDEYQRKVSATLKCDLKQLKSICEMLDLEKSGSKDVIAERIIDFLLEPKDSSIGKTVGRPKRTAAVRANNRGYSSHDNYSSDERHSSRAGRAKGKRSNLKDDSSSQSDEDFQPSDASDEKPRVTKRKRSHWKKAAESDEEDSEEIMETGSSEDEDEEDDSDDEPKRRKKATKPNNKSKGKTPAKRGRKPGAAAAAAKKATKGGKKKNKDTSEDEEEEEEEESDQKNNGGTSSSEDEPLSKKAKSTVPPEPPTDEEIKSFVKEILEGANLEQITMKTVCQQVYNHYPDFDLAHKKDFIKSTVKSLISST